MTELSNPAGAYHRLFAHYHHQLHHYFNEFYLSELIYLLYFEKLRALVVTFLYDLLSFCALFAYCFMILVSGGIFLAAVLLPFVGYKLYQKCLSKFGCPSSCSLSCCTGRRHPLSTADLLRSLMTRIRVVPKVELDFASDLTVGETVVFRILVRILASHCAH